MTLATMAVLRGTLPIRCGIVEAVPSSVMPSRLPIALLLLVPLARVSELSAQAPAVPAPAQRSARPPSSATLDIYIVDTEGGKAALYVSPAGETVLIDTG